MVLHHVDGGGGGVVAGDGRDGVGPGRDDYRLVVVLGGLKNWLENSKSADIL